MEQTESANGYIMLLVAHNTQYAVDVALPDTAAKLGGRACEETVSTGLCCTTFLELISLRVTSDLQEGIILLSSTKFGIV